MTDQMNIRTGVTRRRSLFAEVEDEAQRGSEIDYKMVTFSLAGRDYGMDIMKVAEIAKFDVFTEVPNTQPFVVGVYNLRGTIISVIDLRLMFNLPVAEQDSGEPAEGLVLRLDDGLIGIIVDRVDQVVGVSSSTIQPPHPIFADINLRSISGVVEHDGRLYIILDGERVLGREVDTPQSADAAVHGGAGTAASAALAPEADGPSVRAPDAPRQPSDGPETARTVTADPVELLAETLESLSGFVMSDLNRDWVARRASEWCATHGDKLQITTPEQVEQFLQPFASPCTGRLWDDELLAALRSLLPAEMPANVRVWNPGCGSGYETYSIACLLRSVLPDARLTVWASDTDLLAISTAPNLALSRATVRPFYGPYLAETGDEASFRADLRQTIVFEFSDVTHGNPLPPVDLIVIRDLLSYLPEADQHRVVEAIASKTKATGLVVTGTHEDLQRLGAFEQVAEGPLRAYRRA